MSPGFALFLACDVLGAAGALFSCRRTARIEGKGSAAKEAAVHVASISAFTAVCLLLGYGSWPFFWPQALGVIAGTVVTLTGWRWVRVLRLGFAAREVDR